MRPRRDRLTQFTNLTITVTHRLQSLPSHPVARRKLGKRAHLLQCLEVFLDFLFSSLFPYCCPYESNSTKSPRSRLSAAIKEYFRANSGERRSKPLWTEPNWRFF